jgi:O-antigen/teichoic acid export membrane protein
MFAAVRIYIGQLGLASYGIFTLAMSVLGIAGVFNLGLGEATTKFVAQYQSRGRPDRVTMVVATTAVIYLGIGLLGTLVLFFGAPLIASNILTLEGSTLILAERSLSIVGIGFFPLVAQTVFMGYFDGLQRYRVSQSIVMLRTVLGFGAGATAVLSGGDVVSLLTAIVGVYWLTVLLLAGLTIRELAPVPRQDWNFTDQLREVLSFGLFTGLTSLGTTAFGQLDKVLVGSLISLEAVSIYGVAQGAASKLLAFSNATSRVLMPFFSARTGGDNDLRGPFYLAWKTSIIAALTIGAILIGASPWLMEVWLGPETGSRVLIPLIVFTALYSLHCLNVVPYHYLIGRGYASRVAAYTLGGGLLTLIAIAIIGDTVGVIGSVGATSLYVAAGGFATRYALRTLGEVPNEVRLRNGAMLATMAYLVVILATLGAATLVTELYPIPWLGLLVSLITGGATTIALTLVLLRRPGNWHYALAPLINDLVTKFRR